MTIKVHRTRWKDESTRRRILAYARRRAVTRGRRVVIKIKDRWSIVTKATITPW